MEDTEFIQKAHHIFEGQNINKIFICDTPTILLVEGYFSRKNLIEIAIELIRLDTSTRDKLISELTN